MNPNIPELPKPQRPASNDARKSGCTQLEQAFLKEGGLRERMSKARRQVRGGWWQWAGKKTISLMGLIGPIIEVNTCPSLRFFNQISP